MRLISQLEEVILLSIWRLDDNAFGQTISRMVSQSYQKDYSMGALYYTLDSLIKKNYIKKTQKFFYQTKGRRCRTYYNLTEKGLSVLQSIRDSQKSLWEGFPDIPDDKKKV